MEKTVFVESTKASPVDQTAKIELDSTLNDLLLATLNSQAPKGVIRFSNGKASIAFVCIVSDEQGYMQAIQAYEQGRDEFTLKAVNAVLDHVRKHGVPERNDDLNMVLHA